jgi:hypothetical protein
VTAIVEPPLLDLPAGAAEPIPGDDRCMGRHRRTVLLSLVLLLVWAIICADVLEAPLWWSGDQMAHPALAVFAVLSKPVDVLLTLLVLLAIWCATGRLWLSMGLLLGTTSALSAVNVAKMSILHEPLYPSDYQFLNTPAFLFEMVTPRSLVEATLGLGLLVVATIVASRSMGRRYPRLRRSDHPRGWAALVGTRVVGLLALTLVLSSALHFNDAGNPWRRLYEAQGATWQPFSQAMNYRSNGFIGGALYNLPSEPMVRPADYSAATMRQVAQRYADRAAERNVGRTPGALADVNVVLVLSEAFADLSRLRDVEVARDTMALTRRTMQGAWSGSALANAYGTGTSGMEFSALTGQSVGLFNPQVTAPYQNFMTGLSSYPSGVGWFNSHGHEAVAVHPYRDTMYRRNSIYPMLGFTSFLSDKNMRERDRLENSNFISDKAAFDQVDELVESHDKPLLVNLVTMQNHLPTTGWYDDPVPVETRGNAGEVAELGGYARGQEFSDQELGAFLEQLEGSDEKTVVVFYGDHYPGLFSSEAIGANPGLGMLETPMFIWSSEGQTAKALPVSSPATFLPYVFDLVGEPLPPYYELLSEVAEQVGAIGPGRIVAPDGTEIAESDLTPAQQQLLHDYRLVQYDFSIGRRYAVDDMFYEFGSGS